MVVFSFLLLTGKMLALNRHWTKEQINQAPQASNTTHLLTTRDRMPQEDDGVLHVVIVCFNYANFTSRTRSVLAQQQRMSRTPGVVTYTAELAYGNANFIVTSATNPRHLQLRLNFTDDDDGAPLWQKETLINLVVTKLFPPNWRAFAWVDAEVVFDNSNWATESFYMLTRGGYDALQPFSHGNNIIVSRDLSFAKVATSPDFRPPRDTADWANSSRGSPGYAWAYKRELFESLPGDGLCDIDIGLGTNDLIVADALLRTGVMRIRFPSSGVPKDYTQGFYDAMHNYINAVEAITPQPRVGFVEGRVHHQHHGSLANRQYFSFRMKFAEYDPSHHIRKNDDGLLVATSTMPRSLRAALRMYWASRKEDEDSPSS
jgi:hypothetical protein